MTDRAKYIWTNGSIVEWDKAVVHVMTHAIHYGSGVFEGIKGYETSNGASIFRLDEHVDRLFDSADKYRMAIPYTREEIISGCTEIVRKNNFKDCYIRPVAFYGYDTLGVDPKQCPVDVSIAAFFWGAYLGDDALMNGAKVVISDWKRFNSSSFPVSAKASGQYMNSMLAVQDARARGYDEAILLNQEGNIAEGSGQNIFFVKDGKVYTNDHSASILMGITRDSILTFLPDLDIESSIVDITVDDILVADEVFFCGTASEVTPVVEINNQKIGSGLAGDITLKLREYYLDIVYGRNRKYSHWLTEVSLPSQTSLQK